MEQFLKQKIEYNEELIKQLKEETIGMKKKLEQNVKGIEKWIGYEFESSSGTTEEFKAFIRDFRNVIKSQLPEGSELIFNKGHFYCYGFIKRGDKYVYFSTSDVRHFSDGWYNGILIRTARDEKDFTGGSNSQTTLKDFKKNVEYLLTREF